MAELTRQDGAVELGRRALKVEWAVVAAPARGETQCGDAYVMRDFHNGVLIVVIDAIAHGNEAAQAVGAAVAAIDTAGGPSPTEAISACHRALRWTRGIVATAPLFRQYRVATDDGLLLAATWRPRSR
jgi:hypothetical protein